MPDDVILTPELLNKVIHSHLKKLVKDLDIALAKERDGGSPLSTDEYIKLHARAKRYYEESIVASTEDTD